MITMKDYLVLLRWEQYYLKREVSAHSYEHVCSTAQLESIHIKLTIYKVQHKGKRG